MKTKFIGGQTYTKINGSWHELSACGYLWEPCGAVIGEAVEKWEEAIVNCKKRLTGLTKG